MTAPVGSDVVVSVSPPAVRTTVPGDVTVTTRSAAAVPSLPTPSVEEAATTVVRADDDRLNGSCAVNGIWNRNQHAPPSIGSDARGAPPDETSPNFGT